MLLRILVIWFAVFVSEIAFPQEKGNVYVDETGLMRWGRNQEEVKGFGVNYSVPFAHGFRSAKKLDIDVKEAINQDVYHFSRLGFDLYRIHVWDTEISDEKGNLLENEHLEVFDYLLKQLKDRGINFVITAIAYWGNGWPEPDEDTPGFSNKYGKPGSLTDSAAIKAQENYLAQFLNHVNPYTEIAYKNEPNIIAFEVSNEPHHRGEPEEVTAFIQKMVDAMRSTGTEKPIFYNLSHSIYLAEAYFDADIQGGTFQWYPTGLGFQKELEGNLLPNVDEYHIPFDDVITKNKAAKLVYEFDAADVNKSYIYPAMARSFREAGIQTATHFAYDPTYLAHGNTEYNTHYMNLAYTPQKALALMIAGEVFHQVPVNSDFGTYPENLKFHDFEISYEDDLAVLSSEEKFIYTNSNSLSPKSVEKLKLIAGFGNSELIKYEGKGAYFLDKLEDGVWRLEVMPDALLVDNPFGSNSLEKIVTVINWRRYEMSLDLPALANGFSIEALNEGNDFKPEVSENSISIKPGAYLLKAPGVNFHKDSADLKNFSLEEFSAPESTVERTYVIHEPVTEISSASELEISAEILSNEKIEKVEAWLQNGNIYESIELKNIKAYDYSAEVPEKLLVQGFLEYQIIVTTDSGEFTFPGNVVGNPGDWDFHADEEYKVRVVPQGAPLVLFNALEDEDYVVGEWLPTLNLVPTANPNEAEYQVNVEELFRKDIENPEATPIYDYSFKYNFNRKNEGRRAEFSEKNKLLVKARALNEKDTKLQVALLMKNGAAFGKILHLNPETREYEISLADLKPVKTVTLPRPYPTFLPYYFEHNNSKDFNIEKVESLQFSIGPGLDEEEQLEKHGVGIIRVLLK